MDVILSWLKKNWWVLLISLVLGVGAEILNYIEGDSLIQQVGVATFITVAVYVIIAFIRIRIKNTPVQ